MAKTEYGLQMYSVRDLTEKDLALALQKVAEIGLRVQSLQDFSGTVQKR